MTDTAKLAKIITEAANEDRRAERARKTDFWNGLSFNDKPYTALVNFNKDDYLVIWETINPDSQDNPCDWDNPSAIWDLIRSRYIL